MLQIFQLFKRSSFLLARRHDPIELREWALPPTKSKLLARPFWVPIIVFSCCVCLMTASSEDLLLPHSCTRKRFLVLGPSSHQAWSFFRTAVAAAAVYLGIAISHIFSHWGQDIKPQITLCLFSLTRSLPLGQISVHVLTSNICWFRRDTLSLPYIHIISYFVSFVKKNFLFDLSPPKSFSFLTLHIYYIIFLKCCKQQFYPIQHQALVLRPSFRQSK